MFAIDMIEKFNLLRNEFNQSVKDFDGMNSHERWRLFIVQEKIFIAYFRYLRIVLDQTCGYLYLPSEIIKKAQEECIINDSDIWLKYIEMLKSIRADIENVGTNPFYRVVLNDYRKNFKNIITFLDKNYKEYLILHPEIKDKRELNITDLEDMLPQYSSQILNISQQAYEKFINYLKQKEGFTKVWLHGSRARGIFQAHSDIDLLFDCKLDLVNELKFELESICAPYTFDCISIHDKTSSPFISEFLAYVAPKAKIVFRKEDWK